jgi:predicted transcriptional regulator
VEQPIALSLSKPLSDAVRAAAAWRDMSTDEYLVSVLETASRRDAELAAYIQEGVDCIERGETYSQEEMEAWFEARYHSAAAE